MKLGVDRRGGGEAGVRQPGLGCAPCVNNPSSRRRPSRGCGSATPSAAGSASPATATSAGRSSGRCSGPGSRWRTRPASTRTRGSPTPARRRPGRPARRSTSRSGSRRSRPGRDPAAARRGAARRARRRRRRGVARGSLADRLEAATGGSTSPDADPEQAESAVAPFLGTDAVMVERMTKKGLREFDCRAAVVSRSAGRAMGRRSTATWSCGTPSGRATRRRPRRARRRGRLRGRRGAAADPARPGPPRPGKRPRWVTRWTAGHRDDPEPVCDTRSG